MIPARQQVCSWPVTDTLAAIVLLLTPVIDDRDHFVIATSW